MGFEYTFKNSIPSKKNSKRIIMKNGKPMIISSKEYLEWEEFESYKFKVLYNKAGKPLDNKKFKVVYEFYAPNKRTYDLSNKIESIQDMIAGLKLVIGFDGRLVDDNYNYFDDYSVKFCGISKEYYCKVSFILTIKYKTKIH